MYNTKQQVPELKTTFFSCAMTQNRNLHSHGTTHFYEQKSKMKWKDKKNKYCIHTYIHTRVTKVHINTNAMLLSRSWKLTDRNHGCYHSNSP